MGLGGAIFPDTQSLSDCSGSGPTAAFLPLPARQAESQGELQPCRTRAILRGAEEGCCVARYQARHCHPYVTGEFIQSDNEAALVRTRNIKRGHLGHRPRQTLIYARQHGGNHDPTPGLCEVDKRRNREFNQPSGEQDFLAADSLSETGEVRRATRALPRWRSQPPSALESGRQHLPVT